VDIKPEFQAGVISHPVPWNCDISPRTPAHEALIRSLEKEQTWEPSDAHDLISLGRKDI
jgi:hypothetical protein